MAAGRPGPVLIDEDGAREIARSLVGRPPVSVSYLPIGWGNENWIVQYPAARYIVKVGLLSSAPKWRSAARAHAYAASAGVPVAPLVGEMETEEHLARAYEWVDGAHPRHLHLMDPDSQEVFGRSLGRAVSTLHGIDTEAGGFSSRLDGSAPRFARWRDYVSHRLSQIEQRCAAAAAVPQDVVTAVIDRTLHAAHDVDACARPAICHRDLHADNILVDGRGEVAAILDWDMAEQWDAAGEHFKLDAMLFEEATRAAAAFEEAYGAGHPDRPRWRQRTRVVDLMETLNAIVNSVAGGWDAEFETLARRRLEGLLAE